MQQADQKYLEVVDELLTLEKDSFHSSVENFDAFQKRTKAKLLEQFREFRKTFKKGYTTLIERLQHEGVDIESYKINDDFVVEPGLTFQEILGFSNHQMMKMYDVAIHCYEQKQYEDCLNIFSYLTTLNPFVSSFWLAVGVCMEAHHDRDEHVLQAYKLAMCTNPTSSEPMQYAINYCKKIKKPDEEKAIVHLHDELKKHVKEVR